MTREECFDLWSPADCYWAQWAKPALFAHLTQAPAPPADVPWDSYKPDWAPAASESTALLLDLPGSMSLLTGLALAQQGYRPVPLFNTSLGTGAVVDSAAIACLLAPAAERLRGLSLEPDAPPAFLLDANRMKPTVAPAPGRFDNRWVVFPQDFPSATTLLTRGIRNVLLVQSDWLVPQDDLAHVLVRWQAAGIHLFALDLNRNEGMQPLHISPPSMFRRAYYRALTLFGLRRNNAGGFGAAIPVPSSSSG